MAPPLSRAPVLVFPGDGLLLRSAPVEFAWQPVSPLAEDESYHLELRPRAGEPRSIATTRENRLTLSLHLPAGVYSWRVRIVATADGGDVERAASESYTFSWQP